MAIPFSLTHHDHLDADSIAASGWVSLFEKLPQARFYHHPDWYLAIDQHLLSQPLELCSANSAEGPVAIFPGVYDTKRHHFTAPAHDHLSLGDVLLHPSLDHNEVEQLMDTALSDSSHSLWDWQIGNVPSHSALAAACTHAGDANTQMRQSRESASFDLTHDIPPGGKLRRNLNRLRSKLSGEGEVTLQWVTDKEELGKAYEHFLALESSGWKGQSGSSTDIAHNPDLIDFYRCLLSPTYEGLTPVITLLWLDDKCIAAQFGLQTGSCLSLLKIAYAEEYAFYSPGSLLLQDVLTEAASQSVERLSLVTSPKWATRWHPESEPVWHVTRYANNSGGLALKTYDRLKQSARARLRPAA